MEDCFHNIRLVPERWPRKPWGTKADGFRNRHIIFVCFMHTTLSMLYVYMWCMFYVCILCCTSCMFVDLLVSVIIPFHLTIWILEADGETLGRDCKEINLPCISFTKPFRIQNLKTTVIYSPSSAFLGCHGARCVGIELYSGYEVSHAEGGLLHCKDGRTLSDLTHRLLQQSIVSPRNLLVFKCGFCCRISIMRQFPNP